jgi:hypothetical protein
MSHIYTKTALAEVNQLSGLLPICSGCKTIRNDEGHWQHMEHYLASRPQVQFAHSYYPDYLRKIYPGVAKKMLKE